MGKTVVHLSESFHSHYHYLTLLIESLFITWGELLGFYERESKGYGHFYWWGKQTNIGFLNAAVYRLGHYCAENVTCKKLAEHNAKKGCITRT